MMTENQNIEKKSILVIIGNTADFSELAKDCVCFANARGGTINIGIADKVDLPPADQKIHEDLPAKVRKRISELTINVSTVAEIITASNGGQYIKLTIHQFSFLN